MSDIATVTSSPDSSSQPPVDDFSRQASEAQPSLAAEFLDFLVNNKAWWLTPIILVLMGVGLIVLLSSSAAAPFIYTMF